MHRDKFGDETTLLYDMSEIVVKCKITPAECKSRMASKNKSPSKTKTVPVYISIRNGVFKFDKNPPCEFDVLLESSP